MRTSRSILQPSKGDWSAKVGAYYFDLGFRILATFKTRAYEGADQQKQATLLHSIALELGITLGRSELTKEHSGICIHARLTA